MGAKIGNTVTACPKQIYQWREMRVTLALARTFPPQIQQNEPFIERKSRYWIEARAELKDIELFICQRNSNTMAIGKNESLYSMVYRWREEICSTSMANGQCIPQIHWGKRCVWAWQSMATWFGSGYQNQRFTGKSLYTAISDQSDVHANHHEANSALRRRCSAYRRRQNRYAKNREGLHRAVTVQCFVHK